MGVALRNVVGSKVRGVKFIRHLEIGSSFLLGSREARRRPVVTSMSRMNGYMFCWGKQED